MRPKYKKNLRKRVYNSAFIYNIISRLLVIYVRKLMDIVALMAKSAYIKKNFMVFDIVRCQKVF